MIMFAIAAQCPFTFRPALLTNFSKLKHSFGQSLIILDNVGSIEIIDIECVLGHESCLHFFLRMPFEIRHIEFGEE